MVEIGSVCLFYLEDRIYIEFYLIVVMWRCGINIDGFFNYVLEK